MVPVVLDPAARACRSCWTPPMFEILWYSMATLAPIEPAQEDQLLPLTSYLRGRGLALKAPELLFAQAYLQAVMR